MSAIKSLFRKAGDSIVDWCVVKYQASLGKRLRKFGLRYDDLYDDLYDLDVKEALRRLPQHEVDMRNQRLKRAMDISLKHSELPKELQEKQTPFQPYLQDMLKQVKAERKEYEQLGSRYDERTLP